MRKRFRVGHDPNSLHVLCPILDRRFQQIFEMLQRRVPDSLVNMSVWVSSEDRKSVV